MHSSSIYCIVITIAFVCSNAIVGCSAESTPPTNLDEISTSSAAGVTEAAVVEATKEYDIEFGAIPSQPSIDFIPCNIKDPKRNDCIKGLFTQILPKLKTGIPEYNVPSIDPYFFKRGIFRYATEGVQGGLLIKNMHIHGLSTITVNNIISNFTENSFLMKLGIEIPKLKAGGNFKADVKFGGLRLAPKGPFNITIDNLKATILAGGAFENTETGRHLKVQRLNANLAIGNAHIIADGIFSDKNLNAMILNLVNENLPEVIRVGIPATREQWIPILIAHINDFFANVPIEKFLVHS